MKGLGACTQLCSSTSLPESLFQVSVVRQDSAEQHCEAQICYCTSTKWSWSCPAPALMGQHNSPPPAAQAHP